jgi:hypothetical protein
MLKELFPNGKVLFQNQGTKLFVIAEHESLVDDFSIEKIGNTNDIEGNCFSFSIRLNAVKSNGRKRYTIYPHLIEEFVNTKLNNIGAKIVSKSIVNEGVIISNKGNMKCSHSSVFVSGKLVVENKDKFFNCLHFGIGKAKGFGFGLLNIF